MKKIIIAVCIIVVMSVCQKIYETHLKNELHSDGAAYTQMEADLRKNLIEVDSATAGYSTSTEVAQMEKDIDTVANGLIKKAVQEILAQAKKLNVPNPMLQDTSFLYSKAKLDAAIQRQDATIKQYKKEINVAIDSVLNGGVEAAVADCKGKYTNTDCAKLKKAFIDGFGKAKNELYKSVPVYIDYIEEELNTMRFISNHYNKFTTSGSFPHFTDTSLQNQFMAKVQEIDKKGSAVAELRNNAWKNAHKQISKI